MLQHRVLAWFFAFTAMQILTAVFFAIKEFVALYHLHLLCTTYIASVAAMHNDRGHVLFLFFFIGGHTFSKREESWSALNGFAHCLVDNLLYDFLGRFVTLISLGQFMTYFLGQFVT